MSQVEKGMRVGFNSAEELEEHLQNFSRSHRWFMKLFMVLVLIVIIVIFGFMDIGDGCKKHIVLSIFCTATAGMLVFFLVGKHLQNHSIGVASFVKENY